MKLWKSLFGGRTVGVRAGRTASILCILGLVMLCGETRHAAAQTIIQGPNNHFYEAVPAVLTWTQARDAAGVRIRSGQHGHLVTITSAAEQAFVTANFPNTLGNGYWIGAFQDRTATDYSEPAGGFRWVTGEAFLFTDWNTGEPNNNGGIGPSEDFVILASNGRWNDFGSATTTGNGYIVEYDPKPTFDINGDGFADILFQNSFTNQVAFWFMNGTTIVGAQSLPNYPAAGYALRGTGDFNGDGYPDLVFQSVNTGQIAVWYMNGTTLIGAESVGVYPAAGYPLVAVGDFNKDGYPDLVFQNVNTRQIAIWYMYRTTLIGFESMRVLPAAGFQVVGTGDFNANGDTDLVLQNSSTGAVSIFYMNGGQYETGAFTSAQPSASSKLVGVNDYNNDGQLDFLFQNTANGQLVIWYMNGATFVAGASVGFIPGGGYVPVGPH